MSFKRRFFKALDKAKKKDEKIELIAKNKVEKEFKKKIKEMEKEVLMYVSMGYEQHSFEHLTKNFSIFAKDYFEELGFEVELQDHVKSYSNGYYIVLSFENLLKEWKEL